LCWQDCYGWILFWVRSPLAITHFCVVICNNCSHVIYLRCYYLSFSGENKYYGTPTNPKMPSCIPGGSSSGSAVAVAAGLVDFSIGGFVWYPYFLPLIAWNANY
jgi:hypothetical protein